MRFLGLEAGAASARNYQAELIPGLLQTADYARALIKGGSPYIRSVDVGPRLESRLARQARLGGDNPLRLSALISQAALLQAVGSRAVMAHQLEHLTAVINDQHDHVEVRIMPFSAGAHPLIGYPMTILSFDSPRPQGDRMTTTAHEPRTPAAGGWFTSSRSGPAGECVEINFDHPDGLVRIRDSKDRGAGPTISVTGRQWTIMLNELAGTG